MTTCMRTLLQYSQVRYLQYIQYPVLTSQASGFTDRVEVLYWNVASNFKCDPGQAQSDLKQPNTQLTFWLRLWRLISYDTTMNETSARLALLRLVSIQLSYVGFTHVQDKSLLEDIEGLLDGRWVTWSLPHFFRPSRFYSMFCSLWMWFKETDSYQHPLLWRICLDYRLLVIEGLVHLAYEFAQHTRRSKPNVRDMVTACADQGIEISHLQAVLSQTLSHTSGKETTSHSLLGSWRPLFQHSSFELKNLISLDFDELQDLDFELPVASSTSSKDPTAGFLSSDSESENDHDQGQSTTRLSNQVRKKINPELIGSLPHLPALPAKHTWRETYVCDSEPVVFLLWRSPN